MHWKSFTCDLALPLMRALPRGSVRVLSLLGGGDQSDTSWAGAPRRFRSFRDRQLQATIHVDLADWRGRWHYYPGRYYDRLNQILICQLLHPGDTYIDVGANVGIHTLLASRRVGNSGQVYSFEPNPDNFRRLTQHLRTNDVKNCQAFPCALAETEGVLLLSGQTNHSGTFSLRGDGGADVTYEVSVRRGDDALAVLPFGSRILLKIDVEGYELHVIRGMRVFLREHQPICSVEVTPDWLKQAGYSAGLLLQEFNDLGYIGFYVHARSNRFFKPGIRLEPVTGPVAEQRDILFVPRSAAAEVLSRLDQALAAT